MIKTKNALKGPYWVGEEKHEGELPKGLFPGTDPLPILVCIIDLVNRTRQGTSKSGVPITEVLWVLSSKVTVKVSSSLALIFGSLIINNHRVEKGPINIAANNHTHHLLPYLLAIIGEAIHEIAKRKLKASISILFNPRL